MAIQHYEGMIGTFDYDDRVWRIKELELHEGSIPRLCFNDYQGPISLPKGITSCSHLFMYADLTGCWFEDFDTSSVTSMEAMFCDCKIPEGFTLGDKFDTSNVTNMEAMFSRCTMSKGFSLGDKFNTGSVKDMHEMFYRCKLPEGFTLGDKFDTSNVSDMRFMFESCELPEGFTLGDKFYTSSVLLIKDMFRGCRISEGFSLGDKFDEADINKLNDSRLTEFKPSSKNNQVSNSKGGSINMYAHLLVETVTKKPIGVRLSLDNVGVYVDTTIACFKKLCKLKNISPTRKNDIEMYLQGDTYISGGDESLVLEAQDFNLLDKLYCSDLKSTIAVFGLESSNTKDAHREICNIISSIDKFNKIMFVYIPDKYEAQLKVDLHFKTVEDIVDFVLSYYNKKIDKVPVGSKKYLLSKEVLMSIPIDELITMGDFSIELEDFDEGYVIIGFFPLSDKGYMSY